MDKICIRSENSSLVFITGKPHIQVNYFQIWEVRVPPTAQFFTWLAMQDKILTIDNLIKRGWIITNMYYLCKTDSKSMQDILNECIFTVNLWNYIANVVHHTKGNCAHYITSTSTNSIIRGEGQKYWKQLEITTIFLILKERCRCIFQEKLITG
jgi:zinc-binding in reverse transcriptase